jgi:hypothetical protein
VKEIKVKEKKTRVKVAEGEESELKKKYLLIPIEI